MSSSRAKNRTSRRILNCESVDLLGVREIPIDDDMFAVYASAEGHGVRLARARIVGGKLAPLGAASGG
jgi:hypothetical protein